LLAIAGQGGEGQEGQRGETEAGVLLPENFSLARFRREAL
jgi:hypothetical protein